MQWEHSRITMGSQPFMGSALTSGELLDSQDFPWHSHTQGVSAHTYVYHVVSEQHGALQHDLQLWVGRNMKIPADGMLHIGSKQEGRRHGSVHASKVLLQADATVTNIAAETKHMQIAKQAQPVCPFRVWQSLLALGHTLVVCCYRTAHAGGSALADSQQHRDAWLQRSARLTWLQRACQAADTRTALPIAQIR